MVHTVRRRRARSGRCLALVLMAVGVGAGAPAGALETEPNGLMVPQLPSPTELLAAQTAQSEVHLDQLIISRGEMLESRLDAHLAPDGFVPLCNLTAQLVLRGGTCNVDLGWYNVLPMQALPPPSDQIYSLVPAPATPPPDYTPGVGVQNPIATIAAIRKDSRYMGGLIGFAMMGNATQPLCTQTHFSTLGFNATCTAAGCMNQPWITGLTYQSTAMKDAYYFLFEEYLTTPTDFGNDGDFNDQVFLVTGVTCQGGEQACDTGKLGVCQKGTTQCGKMNVTSCVANVTASADVCDGLDNDCDGIVDPDPTACANPAQICDRGQCVAPCDDVANPCRTGLMCELGVCKTASCLGVVCSPGQRCVEGACQDGCTLGGMTVSCPSGQTCRAGRCVDPCAGVTCAAGQVCEDGACVAPCSCRQCPTGKACGLDNRCVDQGCEKTVCGTGMVCIAGFCQDPCYLVLCPDTEYCSQGQCIPAPIGTPTGGTGGTPVIVPGGLGGRSGTDAAVETVDASPDTKADASKAYSTCSCELGGPPPLGPTFAVAVGAALLLRRRRR